MLIMNQKNIDDAQINNENNNKLKENNSNKSKMSNLIYICELSFIYNFNFLLDK